MLMREIAKIGNRSLVECYEKGDFGKERVHKYVIATNFVEGKPYGNAWDFGDYFDVWNETSKEIMLRAALRNLIGIDSRENDLPYDKLFDITKGLIKTYVKEDDIETEIIDEFELNDDECKVLGVKRKQRYDIKTVRVSVTKSFDVKVVVPKGTVENEYDLSDYVDTDEAEEWADNVSDWDIDTDTEIEVYDYVNDISEESAEGYETINSVEDLV